MDGLVPDMELRASLREPAFWMRQLRALVALALMVWLAWLVANTLWLWLEGPGDKVPPDPHLTVLQSRSTESSVSLTPGQVEGWQLFGAWQAPDKTPDQPVQAPETQLQLQLLGVFQTGDSADAGAIIADQSGNGDLYHPGDSLPGNATLEEVYADRVILRRQGRLETLKLKQPELEGGGVARAQPDNGSGQNQQDNMASGTGANAPGVAGGSGNLAQQRQQIIQGLGLKPVDKSSAQGYRITGSAPKELLNKVGLRPGDVIVAVNGHELGRKSSDIAALKDYRSTGHANIVVQRGAQRFTVNFPP